MKWANNFVKEWLSPWREYLSEFIGVSLFIFFAGSIVISQSQVGESSLLISALGIGFSYVCALYATGHVSLGFLNPAVVIALWMVRRMPGSKAIFYIIFQILGSFVGTILTWSIFGERARLLNFGAPLPGLGINTEQILLIEIIMSSIVVFFVFALSVAKTAPTIFGPLVFGFFLIVATIIASPISGASLFVTRAIGPLALASEFQYLSIYVVGGLAGGLAGVLYEYIFLRKAKRA